MKLFLSLAALLMLAYMGIRVADEFRLMMGHQRQHIAQVGE